MRIFDLLMRGFFGLAGVALMLLALAMIVYAGFRISTVYFPSSGDSLGSTLLEAVGYTIIAIAVFEASKADMALMLYPTLLLLASVALIVGLGAYQRLGVSAEKEVATTPEVNDDPPHSGAIR